MSRDMTIEADGMDQRNRFQRRDDTYLNEQSVIFNEETVGGLERVTTDEERVLRGG